MTEGRKLRTANCEQNPREMPTGCRNVPRVLFAVRSSQFAVAVSPPTLTTSVHNSYTAPQSTRDLGGVSCIRGRMQRAHVLDPGGSHRYAWSVRDFNAGGAGARAGGFVECREVAACADGALGRARPSSRGARASASRCAWGARSLGAAGSIGRISPDRCVRRASEGHRDSGTSSRSAGR